MIPQSVRDQIRKDAEEKYQYGKHLGPLLEGRDRADVDRSRQAHIEAAESTWIKCNEWIDLDYSNMPPERKAVLVWCPSNRCQYTAYWQKSDRGGVEWAHFGANGTQFVQEVITKWKPLPPSPHE